MAFPIPYSTCFCRDFGDLLGSFDLLIDFTSSGANVEIITVELKKENTNSCRSYVSVRISGMQDRSASIALP